MNDFDLESRLRELGAPERSDEYWDDFPSRIRAQLRRRQPMLEPRREGFSSLAWPLRWIGFATTAALIFVCVQLHPLRALSAAVKGDGHYVQSHLSRLDASLHRLMTDTVNMTNTVSEANLN
jgi:hypothetical protein